LICSKSLQRNGLQPRDLQRNGLQRDGLQQILAVGEVNVDVALRHLRACTDIRDRVIGIVTRRVQVYGCGGDPVPPVRLPLCTEPSGVVVTPADGDCFRSFRIAYRRRPFACSRPR
jgi:hypothetical protein